MAVVFNESTIPAETVADNISRQRLLTKARGKGTNILLDRLTLVPGAVRSDLEATRRYKGGARSCSPRR